MAEKASADLRPPPQGMPTESITHAPTDSHFLAQLDLPDKGLAQKAGDTNDVSDVGWGQAPERFNESIVAGLSNQDLWMLIRRFNKQIYHVKAVPDSPLQRLDLNRAEDEQFSPDKLRATMERFYTTIVVSLASVFNHVARLRSWKETRRTSVFCAIYFLAWLVDLLAPAVLCLVTALTLLPATRSQLFPPAPIALVDSSTGGVQKPKAGVLGSHDSITGAPEKMKGEAAEQEARNIVASVASVAVGSVSGKHDQGTPEDAPIESSVPDAMDIISDTVDAQTAARGEVPADSHDKTRQPMRETVINGANQAMRILNDVVDTFERFGNALSPTPPFPSSTPFFRLAAVLIPALLVALVTSSYLFVKMSTFLVGFAFFGDPVFTRAAHILNLRFPKWQRLLQLQNSLLKGIPTNAQLTLTLLRIGEANNAPLPPPPSDPHQRAPSRPASLHHEEIPLAASTEEVTQAASSSPDPHDQPHHHHHPELPKSPFLSRIIHLFRSTTATSIESKLLLDRLRAAAGSSHAKSRVGILHRKDRPTALPSGPVDFAARYRGKRGAMVLDSEHSPAVLYFTTDAMGVQVDPRVESRKEGSVLFRVDVREISEVSKIGGLGWKGKLVAGWAVGGKEVVDGLVVREKEREYRVTALSLRDQLFNRLVAVGGQVWETG